MKTHTSLSTLKSKGHLPSLRSMVTASLWGQRLNCLIGVSSRTNQSARLIEFAGF